MFTFFHIADVHLGAKYLMLGEKAQVQREALKETFRTIIDKAIAERVDALFIAGDLFDSNRVSESIVHFAKNQLIRLNEQNIRVIIVPGTHDVLSPGAILSRADFVGGLSHVRIFNDPTVIKYELPELDLTVWAQAQISNKSTKSPLGFLNDAFAIGTKYNVALAHGSVEIEGKYARDDWPIPLSEIKGSHMNYIALGHWHGAQDFSQGNVAAWYAGSPDITDLEKKGGLGSGHILKVMMDDTGTRVEPLKVSTRAFDEIRIDLTGISSQDELSQKIKEGAHTDLIRVVNLIGLASPELVVRPDFLEEEWGDLFFTLKVKNTSHMRIETIGEDMYPPELLIGQFVVLMKEEIKKAKDDEEKSIREEVLQLGIAELEGRNVIS